VGGNLCDGGPGSGNPPHIENRRQGGQEHAAVIATISKTNQIRQ
jgi:hypothetical protein